MMEQKNLKANIFQKRRTTANFLLLVSGLVVALSGLIIQICYHLGHNPGQSAILFLDRMAWNSVHVWISVGFSFVVAYHIRTHRKWYGNILKRKLSPKSRPTMILTLLMIATALSGFVPLLISFFDSHSLFRSVSIEIHDKVAIVFLIAAIFHTRKRLR